MAWIVAHDPDGRAIVVAPAAPPWASAELVQAVNGAMRAAVTGRCLGCGAVRPARPHDPWAVRVYLPDLLRSQPPPGDVGGSWPVDTDLVPHIPSCAWSPAAIARLQAECRPDGERWKADMREDVIEALHGHIAGLVERLARS